MKLLSRCCPPVRSSRSGSLGAPIGRVADGRRGRVVDASSASRRSSGAPCGASRNAAESAASSISRGEISRATALSASCLRGGVPWTCRGRVVDVVSRT